MKVSGLGFIKRSNEDVFRHDVEDMKPVSQEVDDLDWSMDDGSEWSFRKLFKWEFC